MSRLAAVLFGALVASEVVRRRQVNDLSRTVDYLRGRNQQLSDLWCHERRCCVEGA